MSGEEPRRSGRSTKGQHNKHTSESPAPASTSKPFKVASNGKRTKKSGNSPPTSEVEDNEDGDGDDEVIRCICGNDNPKDKRAFIGCDGCTVWQHNVCMGMPDDDDEVGDTYYCEKCRPEDHGETLEALARGEKIAETRNKIWQNERKMSKNRKSKGGEEKKSGWLKRELLDSEPVQVGEEDSNVTAAPEAQETGTKRKRGVKEEPDTAQDEVKEETPARRPGRPPRQDKRQKSETKTSPAPDPDTALVSIDKLPTDRQKIAQALSKIIADDIQGRAKPGGFKIPDGQTPKSLGEHHGSRIEYSLHINHGGPSSAAYGTQFRTLNANLKKNKTLIEELLAGRLVADELSTMSSSDMASEELQKERATLKAETDRQATIDQRDDGPRYRRTHKGDEIVENEAAASSSAPISRPVRQNSDAEMIGGIGAASPTAASPTLTNQATADGSGDRRASGQTVDMNNIWAKTGQPAGASRPTQVASRRRSSIQPSTADGTKVDADVDRLLADDDDEVYSPDDIPSDIVWRGKVVQTSGDVEPTVNARWVAGRDVSLTIPWKDLLLDKLNIDGRLQIPKAEEYLCGLQWSSSSDVSVLAMTAYDDANAFNSVFDYFKSRDRYAVVNKDKPALLVKDLYIIPIEVGSKLPDHIDMLEHCTIKRPVEERLLLATFVIARAPVEPAEQDQQHASVPSHARPEPTNGHLPAHVRAQSMQGPAGSPINQTGPTFSPSQNNPPQHSYPGGSPLPPNPYAPQQPPTHTPEQQARQATMQAAMEILGGLFNCPTAQQLLAAPGVTRDQLLNMKKIFDEDVAARTDFGAFTAKLGLGS